MRRRGIAALVLVLGLAVASVAAVTATRSTPELGLDLQGGFSVVLSAKGDPPDDSIDKAMQIIRQRIDGLGVAEPEVTRQGGNVVVELPGVKDRAKAQQIVGRTAKLEFRPVLQTNLPYDAKAAASGDDPCAGALAAAGAGAGSTEPGSTPPGSTQPGTTAPGGATTAPGSAPATTPPATTAPATTAPGTSAGDQQEGSADPAAPAFEPAQNDPGTTAPAPAAPTTATPTTAAPGTTAPGAPATTTAPPKAEGPAEGPVVYPTDDSTGRPPTCLALGPVGFEGGALSKSQAALGNAGGSQWLVNVTIDGSNRKKANALFNSCYQAGQDCPGLGGEGRGLLAIALDNEVVSFPEVGDLNLADRQFQISGDFTQGEAKDLALVLRYGALPVEFTRSAEQQVSPTLGRDSLRAGTLAGAIGLALVALYMLVYYRALGVVVVAGVAVWAALMYGVVCFLSNTQGLTLSLSGVVGIVVSIGTTVDSYVVHFERLKDEVRAGKSVRSSTDRGFQRAFRTILTADLASFLGAALLWWLTVGPVRGFAFFLGLSVVLDLFVAYCFDRPMVALLARSRFFTEQPFFGVARGLGQIVPSTKARTRGVAT